MKESEGSRVIEFFEYYDVWNFYLFVDLLSLMIESFTMYFK